MRVDGLEHRWASEGTSSVRTTSRSRGSSITATSDPPAKSTRPLHHAKSSPTRWAPSGPRSSGAGIDPSDSPPVADELALSPLCRATGSAAVTMRVSGDRRHGVDDHARRRVPTQLPGERGDGALGAAVGAGVGRPPARARGDAEDAARVRRPP